MSATMTCEIVPASPNCGAEARGIDVRRIDDHTLDGLKSILCDRCVLVVRGQNLEPEEQVRFAARLGEIINPAHFPSFEGHRGMLRLNAQHTYGREHATNRWHTDAVHEPCPPSFTMLSAVEIPPQGGDTMWANQYLAYETLSDTMKRMIGGLRMVFRAAPFYQEHRHADDPLETLHPIVRVHAVTGRRSIYISIPGEHNSLIEGMTPEESRLLIDFLYRHSQQPEHIYRHRWQAGDLVIWDNRCTLHYAINDYGLATRTMNRIMVKGERPIPAEP